MTPLDLDAIEARPSTERDNLRRVRAMHQASPPEGCDDGDRAPALERVVASLAGGYCTADLDARDVRCLVVIVDDAETIIESLQGQAALLRGEVSELRAKVADLTGDYETGCGETRRLGDELARLRAHVASEPERAAAAVAAERERIVARIREHADHCNAAAEDADEEGEVEGCDAWCTARDEAVKLADAIAATGGR